MKVVLLNTLYHPHRVGGAERSVQLLAEGLLKQGREVVVVTLCKPGASPNQEIINGVRVYRLPLQNSYWPFEYGHSKPNILRRALWHYRDRYNQVMGQGVKEILKREKPILLHTHNITGFSVAVWDVAKSLDIPIIHTIRDYSLLCPRGMYRRGRNCVKPCKICWAYSKIKQKASALVDIAVGVSRFTLERHLTYGFFPNATRAVVHNPVPLPLEELIRNRDNRRAELRFGYLGGLAPHKGVEDLLNALRKLKDEGFIKLLIAGRGVKKYEEALRKLTENLPVTFLGFVPPETLFNQIDVLVVPSRWHEPFGRVVLEAFSFGVPVIASDHGGIPEVVEKGITGWLYDPDDPESLKQALMNVFQKWDQLQEMRYQARRKAETFSIDVHIRQYVNLYDKVAKEK